MKIKPKQFDDDLLKADLCHNLQMGDEMADVVVGIVGKHVRGAVEGLKQSLADWDYALEYIDEWFPFAKRIKRGRR